MTREVQQRIHQREFRERVLEAYRRTCAVCQLKRQELLDAAHIISDAQTQGIPSATKGIALSKLHHSALDANILGIRPDYTIHIREDVLREVDGPMLIHGLQGWNGMKLSTLPTESRQLNVCVGWIHDELFRRVRSVSPNLGICQALQDESVTIVTNY